MKDFLTAFALALTLEGVLYALFPGAMKRALSSVQGRPDHVLRWVGLGAAVLGVALVALVRRALFA